MGDIVRIDPAVTTRACPGCGYLVAQVAVDMARINFKCPRCAEHSMSDFKPYRLASTVPGSPDV